MLCVNLNSPEFKQQAVDNNISENTLELIIHKYRLQTGQEDGNPSDDYVQEQLGNVMYQESSDNVIALWRRDYNHPLVYKTAGELSDARNEAAQFFPESSIVHYIDNNGNFVLNIKEPVKDLSKQNSSYRYSQEMWNIKQHAIADGTFMLAPNGNKSNLNERQWLQVRTRAFKEWFGDWEKEYTPQTNPYKENFWERHIVTEDTGRTHIGKSGKEIPIIINKGVGYVHPLERNSPTKEDPFGFNSFRVSNLISVGQEVDADRPLEGICQVTSQACKDFLKNRYGIESSTAIISAKSPVKDAIIDHWVTVLSINGEAYIYDMPQTEYIKRTKPFTMNETLYYEGVINAKYKPRLIKVTEENLTKYYEDGGANSKQINVINDIIKRLNRENKSVSLNNLTYKPAYNSDVSKVVDENGEPLVVYHGTLGEFTEFDFNKLGEATGQGYYIDHITGEKIPFDSSYAFFFTNDQYAARSYKNLAIWQQNQFRMLVYRNLQAAFQNDKYSSLNFTNFEGKQKQAQADFIDNIISPYLGFDVRKEANAIINGNGNLTESQRKTYAEKFKNIAEKIRNLPDAQSITNQANNLEHNKKDLQFLINHKDELISGKPIDYFKNYMLHISSGYGNTKQGQVYLTIVKDGEQYYVIGLPNTTGRVLITENNFGAVVNEFKKGVAQNEENLAKDEKEGKYDSQGNVLGVFLSIKNPLQHDYNGSSFPDAYRVPAEEGESGASFVIGDDKLTKATKYDTAYIAARQVKKAREQGNDGVIYWNVRDPFKMASYGIFGPNQVKSATDNIGTFSTENNNIYFEKDVAREDVKPNNRSKQQITLKKKEQWRDRAFNTTTRLLSAKDAQMVNTLLEKYMDKAGDGTPHAWLANDFFKNGSLTAEQALDQIISETTDKVTARLAKLAKNKLGKAANVPVVYDGNETTLRGIFVQGEGERGTVHIYQNATMGTDEASAKLSMQRTVLHEIIHAIAGDTIKSNQKLRDELSSIMMEVQNYVDSNNLVPNLYALHSEDEFVSEFMSRPEFREALKLMTVEDTKTKNIFKKVLNWIKKALGLTPRTTLYKQADRVIHEILNNQAVAYYAAELAEDVQGTLDVDKRKLISLLGSRMYQGSVQSIAEKELIQNAFDAVKASINLGQQTKGKIKLDINSEDRTITISDNGVGMTPEIVQKAFFTIGGSNKDGLSTAERSGGLGLAKLQFLFSSENIHLETVRNGKQVVVDATSQQIMDDDFTLKVSDTNKPNGTSVTVKIPESYIDNNGEKRRIWFSNDPDFVGNKPLIGNVEIEVTQHSSYGSDKTYTIDCNKAPDGYKFVGSAQTDFGLIDIYVNPSQRDEYGANSHILSAGLHQFTQAFENLNRDYIKYPFILNIRPSVDASSEIYPINNQRQGFSPSVKAEIADLQKFLGVLEHNIERLVLTEQFDSAFSMNVDDVNVDQSEHKTTDYTDIVQKAIDETNKNFQIEDDEIDSENVLTPSDRKVIGSGEINGTKTMRLSSFVPPPIKLGENKRSVVDTSRFNINKPIFHNNTTLKLSDAAKSYTMEVGRLMIKLREMYKKFYSDDPTGVLDTLNKQFWGISLDKDYGGVNVNPTLFNFLAINPFYISEEKFNIWKRGNLPQAVASYMFHLLFHEFNHNYESGEGARFTGRLPATEAEIRLINGFEDWYNELVTLVENNIETIIKTSLDYANSKNAGKSLEGSSIKDDTTGQEGLSDGRNERKPGDGRNVPEGELSSQRSGILSESSDVLSARAREIEQNRGRVSSSDEQDDATSGKNRLSHFLNGKEYYVENGIVYTAQGTEAVLPDKLKNQILVEDGLAKNTAVEIEHHGNRYVVLDDERIISLQKTSKYNAMKWDERNGDRRVILANARYKLNPPKTPSSSPINAESKKQNTFTFNNGITVNAPFQLNSEQVDALNAMADFIDDPNKNVMTLSGYAGTGKTSLMEMFADMMKKKWRSVKFSASTNKAAGELGKRVNKKGFKAMTLDRLFGIKSDVDFNAKTYNAKQLVNTLKNPLFRVGDVIVIDEASMITEEKYDIIMNLAKQSRLKVIFVGDEAQLAPVGEDDISKVFRDNNTNVVKLRTVERTGDNAILREATRSRNGENYSHVSSFNNQGQGVAFISNKHQDDINAVIDHYAKGLKDDPNYFRILAYTNAAVSKYNAYVRNLFGYFDAIPRVGEPMMGYYNWGYISATKTYRFINSEFYNVVEVKDPVTIKKTLQGAHRSIDVEIDAIPIVLEDSTGKQDTFNYIDVIGNARNREMAVILANEKNELFKLGRTLRGQAREDAQNRLNAIQDFLFVNDDIKSEAGIPLQNKVIDFGYAMTTHKSQGSTFTHVLIDDVDMRIAAMHDNTNNNLNNIQPIPDLSQEDFNWEDPEGEQVGETVKIDLGDLSNVPAAEPKPRKYGDLKPKQRLEYVGVSRATDTATIISDEVKPQNEDSPLNHIGIHEEPVMSDAMRESIELVNMYYKIQKENRSYTDVTASKLAPKEHYEGDYSHAAAIAKDVKGLVNDYLNTMFKKSDGTPRMSIEEINSKEYGNIGTKQKAAILAELERLKNYFNETYGEGQYLITTMPIRVTGSFDYNGTEASIAAMTDLILIDKDGGIHLYNTRVKTFDAKDTANNGMAGIEFIQNAVRQLFENGIGTKVQDVNLIWFNQKYPDQTYNGHDTGVKYTTDRDGNVLVTDLSEGVTNIPLSEYSRWQTPHLAEKVKDSIIPVTRKDVLAKPGTTKHQPAQPTQPVQPAQTSQAQQVQPAAKTFTMQLFEGESPVRFNSIEQAIAYTKFRLLSQYLGFEETKPFLLSNQKLTGEDYKDNVEKSGLSSRWVTRGAKAAALQQQRGVGDYAEEKALIEQQITKILNARNAAEAVKLGSGLEDSGYLITGNSGRTFLDTIWEFGELVEDDVTQAATEAFTAQTKQTPQDNSVNISGIAPNTAAFGVEIVNGSYQMKQAAPGWQQNNPNGIVAYRKYSDTPQTFTPATVNEGWIGNPFSTNTRGAETVQKFYDWIITGNDFGSEQGKANEAFRQAIIDKILSTPEGSPVLYYTELGRPSHATVIGYLINNKHLLTQGNTLLTEFQMHSGGAPGSDYVWGHIGEEFGIKTPNHYYTGERNQHNAPYGNVELTPEDYEEGRHKVAEAAKYNWGYAFSAMKDPRLIRNWAQVKYADAIFAIGHLKRPGELLKNGKAAVNAAVDGGTGYAVGMAILAGKPVYVFDQERGEWYKCIDGKWTASEVPVLTPDFAGIGTREINKAGMQAIRDVYKKTIQAKQRGLVAQKQVQKNLERTLGTDEITNGDIKDAVMFAKKGLALEELLTDQEAFFSDDELEQIKRGLNGRNLQVMSVSRMTDPAFFSKKIVEFLKENSQKPLDDPTRVTAIELWSKHDGLPIKDILDACKKYRVAPMVSFSITGLGGTAIEGGVMKYQDMLERVGELINNGDLNAQTTTIRIDPILIGETNLEDVRNIVETAKSFGIKKFVTSLVQSYGYLDGTAADRHVTSGINNALATENRTYDWDKYYGRVTEEDVLASQEFARKYREEHPEVNNLDFKDQFKYLTSAAMKQGIRYTPGRNHIGKIHFVPKFEHINEVGRFLLELDQDKDITIQTCSFHIQGLEVSACLDPLIIERVVGIDVTRDDQKYARDTSRPECMCYRGHGDMFRINDKCFSSCAYCYAAHSGDNKLNYYNEDGTLKDNEYTRTSRKPKSYEGIITPDANTIFVFGSNPEGRHGAGAAKTAREKFGAQYGQGEGLQGNSYAIPTKDLRSKPLYSEDGGRTPVSMYRGYALTENREAYNIEETIGHTAVDYDDSLRGALYFTNSIEEAQDYAKTRTDRSPEPPTQENPLGRPVNRHYTGDYAKVSTYYISADAKVEHYADIQDYVANGKNSDADVIILDKGTMWSDNKEYIVKNPKVIVYDKMLRSISPEQITESIRKMYETARQNPDKQFKVAYTNDLNRPTLNGYTGAEMIKMFKEAGPIPSNVWFSKNWTDHWDEVEAAPQPKPNAVSLQQAPVPKPVAEDNSPINIWSKEKNGYEGLSNFAQRPFMLDSILITKLFSVIRNPLMKNVLVKYLRDSNGSVRINTVENLFQAMKIFYSDKYIANNAFTPEGKSLFDEITTAFPSSAKDKGNRVEGVNSREWDSESKVIMEIIAQYSFDSNSDAKELLLSTKRRPLTHNQARGRWKTDFPEVLMKIRSKYQKSQSNAEGTAPIRTLQATIAPYVNTEVTAENYDDLKTNVEHKFKQQAHDIATALGLTLEDSNISTNIQSLDNIEGGSVRQAVSQLSYTFSFDNNADAEKVRLFAALMADLGYMPQETAVTLQYVAEDSVNFNAVEYAVKVRNLKGVLPRLEQLGFTDFTVNNTQKEVTVLISRDNENITQVINNFKTFVQELINQNNYVERRNSKVQVERLDKETRRRTYADYEQQGAIQHLQDGQNTSGQSQALNELVDVAKYMLSDLEPIEEQPFVLESYMYITQQNTPEVDAEWKKPFLEKLDDEIDVSKSQESNAGVIETIGKILGAETEQEAREIMSENQRRQEKELDNYGKLTAQIDNLYNSDNINVSDVRHIAEQAVNAISDEITKLQTDREEKSKTFPELKTDLDFTKATRKQIVEAVGINTLLDYAKKLFDPNRFENIDTMWQAWDIVDNWDGIMHFGSDVFILNEGFGINKRFDNEKYETTKEKEVSTGSEMYGDQDSVPVDQNDVVEKEGSLQQHWQVEFRTIDVINELISNVHVKRVIHDCYLKDSDGNIIVDKWGIAERVPVRTAVQSILYWVQGVNSFAEMKDKLKAQAPNNRWLDYLIEKLEDKAETDLHSQFFGVFFKPFQLMSVVTVKTNDKGDIVKYISKPVNRHPAQTEIFRRIEVDFQSAMHTLFTGYGDSVGINMEQLGTKDDEANLLDTSKPINLHRILAFVLQTSRDYYRNNEVFTKEMAEELVPYLTAACRILGFYADEDLVKSALMELDTSNNTGEARYKSDAFLAMRDSLRHLVEDLDKAAAKIEANRIKPDPEYTGYDPFKFKGENNIRESLLKFIAPVTDKLENTYLNCVYDSGKMYQSHVVPSFTTMLMNDIKSPGVNEDGEHRFITDFYGRSEWFRSPGYQKRGLGWRNSMIQELATNPEARQKFEHKVQLNFNKHNFMRTMSPQEYELSLITEYFAESSGSARDRVLSWYKIPMESNKPSAEFIKYYSYRGKHYQDNVIKDLAKMFIQELSRIQTVIMRNKVKGQEGFIENFDTNGRKFCFLPFFNDYLVPQGEKTKGKLLQTRSDDGYTAESDQTLAREIAKKLYGDSIDFDSEFKVDSKGNDTAFMKMVKDAIRTHMEQRTQAIMEDFEKQGILKEVSKIENVHNVKEDVENYLWNSFLMAKNILQLTVGDIAFFKDTVDLQKRLAQLHSPGIRGYKYALDYNGKPVSDGFYRTVVVKDLRKQINFKSNLIANLTEVLDRYYKKAPEHEKEGWLMLQDALVGEHGLYRDVNVTDAQAYSSPTSYRKKAFIFGKWSREADKVYDKLVHGTATLADIRMAFQPLKPFVYGLLEKNLGVDDAPITTMLEPFQAKNSEYLLFMADALLQNEKTSQPNLLRAIYDVMEDSYFIGRKRDAEGNITEYGVYNPKGIDTIQFESAIKVSLQGTIDIAENWNDIDGEAKVKKMLEDAIYKDSNNKELGYNDAYVHKLDYDYYCIQQEVPAHFMDHDQAHGSQIRMITPSDLDFYYDLNGDRSENPTNPNIVYYEVKEWDDTAKKFVTKKLNAKEFRKEYEQTIAENINRSYDNLIKELHLDKESTKKERNLALSNILRREILSSPRYGIDLLLACTVDKDGNFRIPKGDPIQAKRIEQLCNSIIKNRLNKQEIAGGPIVQVSNFGTGRLSVVFKDKVAGGVIMTEDQWNEKVKSGEKLPVNSKKQPYRTYEEYIHDRQGGIAYFECFAPVWAKSVFEKFTRSDGTVDIEAIDKLNPELLKMIGYRIPTEDKYSCAPLKIKGFLPAIAGEAIMLPYELTTINDSDYDVDKEYIMRKVIFINEKDDIERVARDIWRNVPNVSYAGAGYEDILEFVKDPEQFKGRNKFYDILWDAYIKYAYYTSYPKKDTLYRNNKIVDMTYEVLSHETNVIKLLNPGGFDNLKHPAYLIEAFKLNVNNDEYAPTEQEINEIQQRLEKESSHRTDSDAFVREFIRELGKLRYRKAWEDLSKQSIDKLKDLSSTSKDICWADVEVQFYRQNAAASSLIGVQAVNKISHATLEGDGFYVDIDGLCNGEGFTIGTMYDDKGEVVNEGMTFEGYKEIDKTYNEDNKPTGKVLGSTVGGAADAGKDPIYNLVGVNMVTVNLMNTLIRFGMNEGNVFTFMAQSAISKAVEEYNKASLVDDKTTFASIVSAQMEQIKQKYANTLSSSSRIYSEPLTFDEILEGLIPGGHPEIDLKVLNIVQKLLNISNTVRNLDHPTRLNSISSAVGPLIIDNLIMEHKIKRFTLGNTKDGSTHVYVMRTDEEIKDIIRQENIDMDDADAVEKAYNKYRYQEADFYTVLDKHPVLAAFAQGLDVAERMFKDMPAGSEGFKDLLNMMSDDMQDSFFMDRKLLDKLSSFYQTYILVASGLLQPSREISEGKTEIDYYINDFPEYFRKISKSEEYRKELDFDNNPFLKAIQPDIDETSHRLYLKINMTGFDPQMKQPLSDGWIDLFKKSAFGKELATKLMIYNIYRGGAGFNPKTFTALITTFLKENFVGKDRDGNDIRYSDVFELSRLPNMINERILDQFIRNNWNDYRLVSYQKKTDKFGIDYDKGELTVWATQNADGSVDNSLVEALKSKKYISTDKWVRSKDKDGKPVQTKTRVLWRLDKDSSSNALLVYEQVKPLGNNGDYLEMDITDIKTPLTETSTVISQEDSSTSAETPKIERENNETPNTHLEKDVETMKEKLIRQLFEQTKAAGKNMTLEGAERRLLEIKEALKDPSNHNSYKKFLHNLLEKAGVEVDMDKVIEKFNEFC